METETEPPVVGRWYCTRGFTFRVDLIENGEVYVVRWDGRKKCGVPLRVILAVWAEQMHGARLLPERRKANA